MHEDKFGALVGGLKERRGRCPEVEEIAALARGALTAADRRRIESHVRLCPSCRELRDRAAAEPSEVDDLEWHGVARRLDRRPAPWRHHARPASAITARWLAAAAVLVLGVGLATWIAKSGPGGRSENVSTTRGATIDLAEPAGLMEEIGRFSWSAPPVAGTFRLEVAEGERTLFEAAVPDGGWQADERLLDELEPDVRYRWRVTVRGPSGAIVARSEWAEFRLAR